MTRKATLVEMKKFAIIGTGNMGGALIRGFISRNICAADEIICTAKSEQTRERIANENPGVVVSANNADAVCDAEVVILAVKPWLAESVMSEIRGSFGTKTRALISVAAGVSLEKLRALAGTPTLPIFVAIPNTAIAIAQSMTFVAADSASDTETQRVCEIFSKLGSVALVPEKQLAAGTAVASCGIAFAMRYIRAAMEGGIELGLPASVARAAVLQTIKGAAELLTETGEHPEEAIDKVTTPGGITIRGLNKMEENGFSAAVVQGLRASGK